MSNSDNVRWSLVVSRETDRNLRAYLGEKGMRKGDLSKFIEEAVRHRVFEESINEIKERNRGIPEEEILRISEQSLAEVRAEKRKRTAQVRATSRTAASRRSPAGRP